MNSRVLSNSLSVLLVTAVTTVVIYAGVSSLEPATATAYAQTSGRETGTLVCPATGCTAVSCHATQGDSGVPSSGTAASTGTGASSTTGDGQVQTCPRTGCTSIGCHATDGTGIPRHGRR